MRVTLEPYGHPAADTGDPERWTPSCRERSDTARRVSLLLLCSDCCRYLPFSSAAIPAIFGAAERSGETLVLRGKDRGVTFIT
jgi:hypothetical protein